MENSYGIGVKNRYELFYDEQLDPLEILRQKEEEKEKRKADKANPKDKSKNAKSGKTVIIPTVPKKTNETSSTISQKSTDNTDTSNKPRSRPFGDRNAKNTRSFDDSKDTEEKKNFRNREEHGPSHNENRERDGEIRRGRGGYRGRGRPRGRGGFFENRPPRREFDRHSGSERSGVRPLEKRDGSGPNNWGDMKNDLSTRRKEPESSWGDEEFEPSSEKPIDSNWGEVPSETEPITVGKEDTSNEKTGDDAITDNPESKENGTEEPKDEGAREMTLDEWKREQEAKRAIPKYNLRKPGEGEDGNQWKKLYVLKKKVKPDDDDEEEEEDDEDADEDDFARRGRQRQLVDIQINFNDSRRGTRGRGRGTRGLGPRGERGSFPVNKEVNREDRRETFGGPNVGRNYRGSMKIKSGQQSAPRVDDWNDFPSLVTA